MNGFAAFWRRYRRNRAAVVAAFVLILILAVAIAGPLLYPVDPFDMVGRPFQPPLQRFLLGTDVAGRDILAGLLHGARVSLLIGVLASVVATAILTESVLSFLGLSDPNVVSWGYMIGVARTVLRTAWWMAAIPGVMILITVLAINLVGEGLNDALNPRLRRR